MTSPRQLRPRQGIPRHRRFAKADAEFRWFVRTYTARDRAGKAIKEADTLLLVAQAGARTPLGTTCPISSASFSTSLRRCPSKPTRPVDRRVSGGMLLLEKLQPRRLQAAFDKALTINSRAAEALVGKAGRRCSSWN